MELINCGVRFDDDRHPVLVGEASKDYRSVRLDSPSQVADMMFEVFDISCRVEEYLYLIAFDGCLHPLYLFELSHGTSDVTVVGVKELFMRVLMCGASKIILVHNHPGGDAFPSQDDRRVTKKISRGADYLEIGFTDHIILGDGCFYSFREHGEM